MDNSQKLVTDLCHECPLKALHCLAPHGSKNPLIYVLGKSYGAEEIKKGRAFVGKSGKMLRSWLVTAFPPAIDPDKHIRWNNAIRCFPPNHNVTPSMLNCCRPSVIEDIKKHSPALILAIGSEALQQLFKFKNKPTIYAYRGYCIPSYELNCWVMPLLHPSGLMRQTDSRLNLEELERTCVLDIKKAIRYLTKPLPERLSPNIVIPSSYEEVKNLLTYIDSDSIAFDFETSTTNYYERDARIVSIAIAVNKCTRSDSYAFSFLLDAYDQMKAPEYVRSAFKELMLRKNIKKIAHDLKFELHWLKSYFNVEPSDPLEDTILLAHLNDPREYTHSLEFQGLVHFGYIWKIDIVKAIKDKQWDKILKYNAEDAFVTLELYNHLVKSLTPKMYILYKELLIEAVKALVFNESQGLIIDYEFIQNKKKDLEQREAKYVANIKEILRESGYNKELSLDSSQQIGDFLYKHLKLKPVSFTAKTKRPSTDKQALTALYQNTKYKFLKYFLEYRKIKKLYSTYVEGMLNKVYDGKMYPNHKLYGTATGRLSTSNPSTQNFPKRENVEMRNIFKAPDDYIIVSMDYKQIEFRVAVSLIGDMKLIKQVNEGLDVHSLWSTIIYGTAEYRQKAKNGIVFPTLYGAGIKTVANGLGISEKEAAKYREQFLREYSAITPYQRKLYQFYKQKGYVETPLGRRRHRPLSWNMIINNNIQSVSSDFVLYKMTRLTKFIRENNLKWWIPLSIHDEVLIYMPYKDFIRYKDTLIKIMQKVEWEFEKLFKVPMGVEIKIGLNWGSLIEVNDDLFDKLKDMDYNEFKSYIKELK